MRVLMKDRVPVLFPGKIKGNILAITGRARTALPAIAQKEAGQVNRLSVVQRRKLAQYLVTAEGNDLQRRCIHVEPGENHAESNAHFFKTLRHAAGVSLAAVSKYRKMRRSHLHPLLVGMGQREDE